MHKKLCVTSGTAYTDIDVLACAIAFAELNDCDVVLPGAFNATLSKSIRKWNLNFRTKFEAYDQFVIVDMSNPKYVPKQISENKIVKVFDHHTGFENYWGNPLREIPDSLKRSGLKIKFQLFHSDVAVNP